MQPLAFFAILKRKTADNNNNYEAKAETSLYKKNPVLETIDTCMTETCMNMVVTKIQCLGNYISIQWMMKWLSEKLEHDDNLVLNTFKRLKTSPWFIYCDILGKAPPTVSRLNSTGSFAVCSFLKSEYGSLYKKSLIENMSTKSSTTEIIYNICDIHIRYIYIIYFIYV